MTGFIYIWRDRKHNRYYIGSHWGTPDDGYICSSTWMKQAYKIRQHDFKRRILKSMNCTRKELLEEERKWLNLIKETEIGKRYYNLKGRTEHWSSNDQSLKTVGEKILASPLRAKRIGDANRGKKYPNRKKCTQPRNPMSKEVRLKISNAHRGKLLSAETKLKMSVARNNRLVEPKQSEETKQKRSVLMTGHFVSDETRKRISEAKRGKMSKLRGTKQTELVCPHCQKVGGTSMHRWHFDNCKLKGDF